MDGALCLYNYITDICLFPGVKVTIIHPATAKHIAKFSAKECIIVDETPQLYKDVLLEHLKKSAYNVQASAIQSVCCDL